MFHSFGVVRLLLIVDSFFICWNVFGSCYGCRLALYFFFAFGQFDFLKRLMVLRYDCFKMFFFFFF